MKKAKFHYVYIIQSKSVTDRFYTGFTENIENRLKDHNEGRSPHTSKHKPWSLITYLVFSEKSKAVEFETYLKSGPGHAFANKRLC
jgi:predicted GIY-YIG superfamily endonuclease